MRAIGDKMVILTRNYRNESGVGLNGILSVPGYLRIVLEGVGYCSEDLSTFSKSMLD